MIRIGGIAARGTRELSVPGSRPDLRVLIEFGELVAAVSAVTNSPNLTSTGFDTVAESETVVSSVGEHRRPAGEL